MAPATAVQRREPRDAVNGTSTTARSSGASTTPTSSTSGSGNRGSKTGAARRRQRHEHDGPQFGVFDNAHEFSEWLGFWRHDDAGMVEHDGQQLQGYDGHVDFDECIGYRRTTSPARAATTSTAVASIPSAATPSLPPYYSDYRYRRYHLHRQGCSATRGWAGIPQITLWMALARAARHISPANPQAQELILSSSPLPPASRFAD